MCYQTDRWVDESIIGFLSVFSIGEKPLVIFHYSRFLVEVFHEQFLKFSTEGVFKHATILDYLFLFHQEDRFQFPLYKLDEQGNAQSTTHWNSLVRKHKNEFTFSDYVDHCLYKVSCLLNSEAETRIRSKIKRILQLNEQTKIGD